MVSKPPASSPIAPPTALVAEYTPIARFRDDPSGKVVAISASAAGAVIAAPVPWTARAASSQACEVAMPPASEPAENSRSPAANILRRPSRSPARPPMSRTPPKVTA